MLFGETIDADELAGAQRPRAAFAYAWRATPRACALRIGRDGLPKGMGERFAGYGVMALPFAGGDMLAFRSFASSSIGPAYAAIWHRGRGGDWTFYVTVDPALSCPRYFGSSIERVVVTDIETTWVGHDHLVVSAPAARVEWSMRIHASPATRAIGLLAGLTPARAWRIDRLLDLAGAAAGIGLGAGPLRLRGFAPNGQRFRMRPRRLWRIGASAARLEGRELGPLGSGPADLGGFRLPGTGLFACGWGEFEPLDPLRHDRTVGRKVEQAAVKFS